MPSGLLIDLNDGGKPMEITAGLRCPSFGGRFTPGTQQNKFVDVAGYVSGSQIVPMLYETTRLDSFGNLHKLNSLTISGGRVTQNSTMKRLDTSERESTYTFPGSVWQIFPISQRASQGLLISNSSDFTSISTATQSGQCIWKGTVNVGTGGWATPTISGYSRDQYVVFGRCNSGNTIDFDGYTVRFYQPPSGRSSRPTTGTIDIVIFASGRAPVPGPGLNIFNADGQCTFSTTKRPLVYLGGMWSPSTGGANIGNGYVPLGRFGFNINTNNGAYTFWMYGMRILNNVASVQGGVYLGFDEVAIFGNNQVTSMSLPVLPDMYV